MFYPDAVEITTITIDPEFKDETEGTPFPSKAYVEEESEIRYGGDGQPLDSITTIFLPPNNTNMLVKEGDYIKIPLLHGNVPNTQEAMRKRIARIIPAGSFVVNHLEVLC